MHARNLLAIAAAFVTLTASTAHANDSAMGGTGHDLVPERETVIRMLEEDIVLEQVGAPSRWRIEARYVFENPSASPVELTMGFPERRCDPEVDGDCIGDGRFEQMQTFVRGVQVGERIGEVGPRSPWRVELGRVFLCDVRFEPHERVEVRHVYRMVGNESVMGHGITYVTRTGANWNGPIGRARFTIRLPSTPPILEVPPEYEQVAARYLDRSAAGFGYEVVFEMTNWTPRRNLEVSVFSLMTLVESAGCPWDWDAMEPVESTDVQAIVQAYAQRVDPETLRFCRNLAYARHGRPFRTRSLARRFFRRGIEVDFLGRRVHFLEDPAFTEARLTTEDHRYVAFVARVMAAQAASAAR